MEMIEKTAGYSFEKYWRSFCLDKGGSLLQKRGMAGFKLKLKNINNIA